MPAPTPSQHINVNSGDLGEGASLLQVYAPGHASLAAEQFTTVEGARPFTSDWLLFNQQSVPLLGRDREMELLDAFTASEGGFRWWAVSGAAGMGKSRLAYDWIERNQGAWLGGFIPAHAKNIGTFASWTPSANSFWVLDYATLDQTVPLLSLLAARFGQSSVRVRLLLLDRQSVPAAHAWDGLFDRAGHASPLLRRTLFDQPLQLQPLEVQAGALLRSWLLAADAGKDALELAAALKPNDLLRATDHGRPLLLGLVAAALWRGQQINAGYPLMPNDLIDLWLQRELRFLNEGKSAIFFGNTIRLLSIATYVGGLPLADALKRADATEASDEIAIEADNRAMVEDFSTVLGVPDPMLVLRHLEQHGITCQTKWALRPDALGERLLHHVLSLPLAKAHMAPVLPEFNVKKWSRAFFRATTFGAGHVEVLARMPDTDVKRALELTARHSESTMFSLMVTMRYVAIVRNRGLPYDFVELLQARLWKNRHQPNVEALARSLLALSVKGQATDANIADAIKRLRKIERSQTAKILLKVVPYMLAIGNLQGPALLAIFAWFSDWEGLNHATSAREIILALEVVDRVCGKVIALTRNDDGFAEPINAGDELLAASVADGLLAQYRRCSEAAQRIKAQLNDSEEQELRRALAKVAVNASYALLIGDFLPETTRRRWLEAACEISFNGHHWCPGSHQQTGILCMRNYLASGSLLDLGNIEMLELGLTVAESYVRRGLRNECGTIAGDLLLLAERRQDVAFFCRVVNFIESHLVSIEMAATSLANSSKNHGAMLGGLLAAKLHNEATEFVELLYRLAHALPVPAWEETCSQEVKRLVHFAIEHRLADVLNRVIALAEEEVDPSRAKTDAVSTLGVVTIARVMQVSVEQGYPLPWRRVRVNLLAPDDPAILEQIARVQTSHPESAMPGWQWIELIWIDGSERRWLLGFDRFSAGHSYRPV